MKTQCTWVSIYLLITLTLVSSQQTPLQSCHASSQDTQCLIDYIAYHSAPEHHILQLIHGETRQIHDDTRELLVEAQKMSQRIQSLQQPSNGLMSPDSTAPSTVPEATSLTAMPEEMPRNCRDIQLMGNSVSGVYTIYPFLLKEPVNVYCDLYEDGGGWIVFQRRRDGSVNFNRTWSDYKNGFGGPDVHQELWLGNKYLNAITDYATQELRVDLGAWDGSRAFAKYSRFHVSSEDANYRLYLGSYSGNAGDSMAHNKHRQFSTFERDQDSLPSKNCALSYSAGFWFGTCTNTNINGPYKLDSAVPSVEHGVTWLHWKGSKYSLRFTEMKIRPLPYESP